MKTKQLKTFKSSCFQFSVKCAKPPRVLICSSIIFSYKFIWHHFCRWRSPVAWPISQLWLQCCRNNVGWRMWWPAGTVDCKWSSWSAYVRLWYKVITLLNIVDQPIHQW